MRPAGEPRARGGAAADRSRSGAPLNVLYLIDSLAVGGAESSVAEMLPALRAAGVEVTLVALRPSVRGVEELARRGGHRPEVLAGGGAARQVLALRRRLRVERPALLHTTLFRANLTGRLAAWGTGVPVLTSLVNTSYDPIRFADPRVSARGLRLVRAVDRRTARLTTHFHALTRAVKEAAVRDLAIAPERITVIERGRDAARLGERTAARRARARAGLGLAAGDEVVVHVGRHVYQKGQRTLIEAMDRLAAARPGVVLLLVGPDGPTTEELRRAAERSSARQRIRFLGHREDVAEILAAADLFAFPSLYEGLGGALVEAMALGLPIVASDLPATREVLEAGHNAILVERSAPDALAAAVAQVLGDPARAARMGAVSRAIFERRFRLEDVVARTAALYRRLAAEAAA